MLADNSRDGTQEGVVPTVAADKVLERNTVTYVSSQLDNARGSADALAKDIKTQRSLLLLSVTVVVVFVVVTLLCFAAKLYPLSILWSLVSVLFAFSSVLLSKSVRYEKEQMFWLCEDIALHKNFLVSLTDNAHSQNAK